MARAWPLAAGPKLAPDPNRKLKFGLIGIGARCRQHIERINDRKSCEILAICDIREDRLDDGLEICRGKPTPYL